MKSKSFIHKSLSVFLVLGLTVLNLPTQALANPLTISPTGSPQSTQSVTDPDQSGGGNAVPSGSLLPQGALATAEEIDPDENAYDAIDTNADGSITAIEAIAAYQGYNAAENSVLGDANYNSLYDVDEDGDVDEEDIEYLNEYIEDPDDDAIVVYAYQALDQFPPDNRDGVFDLNEAQNSLLIFFDFIDRGEYDLGFDVNENGLLDNGDLAAMLNVGLLYLPEEDRQAFLDFVNNRGSQDDPDLSDGDRTIGQALSLMMEYEAAKGSVRGDENFSNTYDLDKDDDVDADDRVALVTFIDVNIAQLHERFWKAYKAADVDENSQLTFVEWFGLYRQVAQSLTYGPEDTSLDFDGDDRITSDDLESVRIMASAEAAPVEIAELKAFLAADEDDNGYLSEQEAAQILADVATSTEFTLADVKAMAAKVQTVNQARQNDLNGQIDGIQSEIDALNDEKSDLEDEKNRSDDPKLNREIKQLERLVSGLDGAIAFFERLKERRGHRYGGLLGRIYSWIISILTDYRDHFQRKLDKKRAQASPDPDRLAEIDTRIAEIDQEIANRQSALTPLQTELGNLQGENAGLNAILAA